jgi:hypothetical protein
MTAAALAMGRAAALLESLKTAEAIPPELEALDQLLKAQGEDRKRQVTRQAGAGGSNRSAPDLSSLFDKELQRHQQTNYETPTGAEEKADDETSLLDKVRELATRQDELLRRQQNLARDRERMTAEELKRALETLAREQTALRQRAEDVARQMSVRGQDSRPSSREARQQGEQGQQSQGSQAGQQSQSGQQQGQSGQPSGDRPPSARQNGESGREGQQADTGERQAGGSAPGRDGDERRRLRDASEEMRGAVSELRRDDPDQATERSARALDALRELERRLREDSPDERRRAVGDLQLEARQLADAQRQVASELGKAAQGEAGRDTRRRLAGEQDRLAERAEGLRQKLDRQASASRAPGAGRQAGDTSPVGRALNDASRELERQRITERMRQAAERLRASGGPGGEQKSDAATRSTQEQLARAFDRLADSLGNAAGARDGESQRLADDLARARELREQMRDTAEALGQLAQAGGGERGGRPAGETSGRGTTAQPGAQAASPGRPGSGAPGAEGEVARLQEQYQRQLRETRELLDRIGQTERDRSRGGMGRTFEGQGMVLSAPGTEAFKQDFARWEELRRQATQALERAESSLAERLQAREGRDRLASGVDDRPPPVYSEQVDRYFKALATKKAR